VQMYLSKHKSKSYSEDLHCHQIIALCFTMYSWFYPAKKCFWLFSSYNINTFRTILQYHAWRLFTVSANDTCWLSIGVKLYEIPCIVIAAKLEMENLEIIRRVCMGFNIVCACCMYRYRWSFGKNSISSDFSLWKLFMIELSVKVHNVRSFVIATFSSNYFN